MALYSRVWDQDTAQHSPPAPAWQSAVRERIGHGVFAEHLCRFSQESVVCHARINPQMAHSQLPHGGGMNDPLLLVLLVLLFSVFIGLAMYGLVQWVNYDHRRYEERIWYEEQQLADSDERHRRGQERIAKSGYSAFTPEHHFVIEQLFTNGPYVDGLDSPIVTDKHETRQILAGLLLSNPPLVEHSEELDDYHLTNAGRQFRGTAA